VNKVLASSRKRLWQRMKEREKMKGWTRTLTTKTERNLARTVAGNFQDYGFCFFQLIHPTNFVEWANPGYWIFYRTVFGQRCFLYLKTIKYKILLIAHKNIFSKRIWGLKNLIDCLKTFIGRLKKPYCAIITEQQQNNFNIKNVK